MWANGLARAAWLVVCAVWLSACAQQPSRAPALARPAQAETAPFALNGRVAINYQGKRHSAGLRWTHQADSDEVLLLAPLGQTAARVYRDAAHATLDEGDRHHQAGDVEALMQQVLGWHLPLSGLHQWVLALPARDSAARIERAENGQLSVLHQAGWEVRYLRFADGKVDSLPTRMQLSHEDLQVQLLIDEWDWSADQAVQP